MVCYGPTSWLASRHAPSFLASRCDFLHVSCYQGSAASHGLYLFFSYLVFGSVRVEAFNIQAFTPFRVPSVFLFFNLLNYIGYALVYLSFVFYIS